MRAPFRVRGLVAAVALGALALPLAVHASATSDRDLIGQLDREVIALHQKVKLLEQKLTACGTGATEGTIYTELLQVFPSGPVKVERSGAETLVTLPGDMLFSTGTIGLREEAGFAIDLLATALRLHPEVKVLLVGHTDSDLPSGPLRRVFPSNWELSFARAQAVFRALTEKHGIPAERITIAARADLEPLTGNDTPEGRSTNRRVVAHLVSGAPPS